MKIAFITEEFGALEPSWDNSILFAREFARRGHAARFAPKTSLCLSLDGVTARFFANRFADEGDPRPDFTDAGEMNLKSFDLVMLRIDPPVDATYLAVTHMLDYAGTLVLNRPAAIRQYNEKIAILSYPEGIVETAVVLALEEGIAFIRSHPGIRRWIAKPTNAFGGIGVSAFAADDEHEALGAMARAAGERREPIMLQRFNERIVAGDKRIFLVEGRPVGWVNRVPKPGEYLANIHAGAVTLPYDLDDADRAACAHVARHYPAADLPLICIDVIGDRLSEVNVTCPSGMIQINRAMGRRCESEVVDCLERRAREERRCAP